MTATPTVAGRGLPLRAAARSFAAEYTARVLAVATALTLVLRFVLGRWGLRDAIVAAAIVVVQPFTEWVIHVYVLHFRARTIRGRKVDLYLGYKHRLHHQDPKNVPLIFFPRRALHLSLLLHVVLWVTLVPIRPAVGTALLTSLVLTSVYEWTHFLIHSDYVPRHGLYRGLWRAHRLHHFRNENYWFGVTMHLGDRVLGTYPAKEDVPLSATALTLANLAQ